MKILNNNQQLTVHVCLNFKNRLLGMMGQKKEPNYGLFFPHCHSIHTCFMKFPIDIYIVDYNNTIIFCKKKIKPWKFVFYKKGYGTYEFPAGMTNFQTGERIKQIA